MDDDCVAESEREAATPDEHAIGREQVLTLSDRDMDALLAAIASPPPPNVAMLRSVQRWREHGAPMYVAPRLPASDNL